MPKGDAWKPLAALWTVQFLFATLVVAGKYVLNEGFDPFALAAIRVFGASLLLALLASRGGTERVAGRDLATLSVLALLGVVFNQLLFLNGLERTTAVNASLLIATIPIFTLLAAVTLRREHFSPGRLFGVLISLGGAMLLLGVESFNLSRDVQIGNLLITLNSLSYSFYLVLSRPMLQRYRSITVVAWTFLLGSVTMVPIGTPALTQGSEAWRQPGVLLVLAWIVIGPSVGSYALNNYALKRVHASTVGAFVVLQPLLAIAMALLLLPGERLGWRDILGGLLILSGVLAVSRIEARAHESQTQTPLSQDKNLQQSGGAQP